MKALFKWLAGIVSAVLAGLIVYWLTMPQDAGHVDPPPQDPCEPLPAYLSELKLLPPSWPRSQAPLILEFEASGPDPQGRIKEYRWEYNGEVKTGPRVKFTLRNRGANIVSLRVTDVEGCTVHRQRRILLH